MSEEAVQVIYPVVELVDEHPMTTSLNIAEVFGKSHKNVMQSVQKLDIPEEFNRLNFQPIEYTDTKGRKQSMYKISRDGFMLLVMGYTGKQAMRFKIAYIEAFNRMERALSTPKSEPPPNLSDSAISPEIWQRVCKAGSTIKISDRAKLLRSACQMSRIDQTRQHTRESILIDFADLCSAFTAEKQTSFEGTVFQEFLAECCTFDPDGKINAAAIYARFAQWYHCTVGGPAPSGTWFGRLLTQQRLRKQKSNGVVFYYGIRLKDPDEVRE